MTTVDIPLRRPHGDLQRLLVTYPGSLAAFCGRRWGKTDGNTQRIYYHMQQRPGLYWWVGLSWKAASMKRAWREMSAIARAVLASMGLPELHYINRSTHEIKLPGLGEIWFRTADNPPSLAGEGIMGAVVDEFSLMPQLVWTEYLEATLVDTAGWVSFAGVPKGRNWAANIYNQAAERDGWEQIHATSYDNPHISHQRLDDIRDTTPEDIWRQEYMAEILANQGAVFRNIAANMTAPETTPAAHDGHNIVGGVDWGKQSDFTTISLGCVDCNQEVARDRFNKIDYTFQRGRLMALCDKWQPSAVNVETNSIGMPNFEELQREGLPVYAFETTAKSKPQLIENLALSLEKSEFDFQDDSVWTAEMEAYERKVSQNTGRSTYSAPEGMHDDTVIARALMLWQANNVPWLI